MMRLQQLSKHLVVLVLLSLPLFSFAQHTDSLLLQLNRKWDHAKMHTLQMAELMPEAYYDFKPTAEEMSFKEQLLHMAKNMQWLSAAYLMGEKAGEVDAATMDKAAVIKWLASAYDIGSKAHATIKSEQLNETVNFFAGPMSRRQMLLLMHDHQTHHAGQLIVYLRLKGIKPPPYIGW